MPFRAGASKGASGSRCRDEACHLFWRFLRSLRCGVSEVDDETRWKLAASPSQGQEVWLASNMLCLASAVTAGLVCACIYGTFSTITTPISTMQASIPSTPPPLYPLPRTPLPRLHRRGPLPLKPMHLPHRACPPPSIHPKPQSPHQPGGLGSPVGAPLCAALRVSPSSIHDLEDGSSPERLSSQRGRF